MQDKVSEIKLINSLFKISCSLCMLHGYYIKNDTISTILIDKDSGL
jgi:hypothetical protein